MLTREDILNIPDAPKGERACDFPEKDEEFVKQFFKIRGLLYKAARELTGETDEKPDFWLRVLNVLKVTGLPPRDYNLLKWSDEIKVLRAAAKMKRQEQKELLTALKELLTDLTKASGGKARDTLKIDVEKTKKIKGFRFSNGQAFYDNKDLKLSAGETVDILKKLADSLGKTVKHTELDSQSSNSNASDYLRGRITAIRTALKKSRVSYRIRSMRGIGYILEHT